MSETDYQENLHFIMSHPEAVAREMTRLRAALREIYLLSNDARIMRKARAALGEKP